MVPIATGCSLSANGISVSMVTGCTRANLRRVCGSCTSCFLHRNDQPTTSAHEHPPPPRVTEQVLLGAQVTQVNIDVGTLCTSVTEGGDWLGGRDEENQSSSLYFFVVVVSVFVLPGLTCRNVSGQMCRSVRSPSGCSRVRKNRECSFGRG